MSYSWYDMWGVAIRGEHVFAAYVVEWELLARPNILGPTAIKAA